MVTKAREAVADSTSPQLKIVLTGEDYGLKVSIRENKAGAFLNLPLLFDDSIYN